MSPLSRRDLLRAGGVGAAGLAGAGALVYATSDDDPAVVGRREIPPNVVVIVIDNLRADHVGAYGSKRVKTPSIDALARESVRFTHSRPEAFPTVAARRAILTGRRSFPFRDWKLDPDLPAGPSWSALPRRRQTFLALLGEAGYSTAYVSDNPWILARPFDLLRRRLDFAEGVPGQVPARHGQRRRVSDAEVRRYVPLAQRGTLVEERTREYLAANEADRVEDDYGAARVFRSAAEYLERAGRRLQPFALVVDAFSPHEPFDPPPSFIEMYGDPDYNGADPIQAFAPPIGKVEELGPQGIGLLRRVQDLYAAEVSFTDRWVGNFLGELDRLKLADETMVVLLSDHGVLLGEHGFVGKTGSQSYREVIDVPWMLRHPERMGAGTTSDFFASTHDVAPTALAAAGLTPPGAMDGEDLGVVAHGLRPPERPVFTASYDDHVVAGDGRWLLLADNLGMQKRLYDTRRDPGEQVDVASRRPKAVDRLWNAVLEDAGGTLPRFGPTGVISG